MFTTSLAMIKPLNINLVEEWLKFADVSNQSVKTYNKSIRRFFAFDVLPMPGDSGINDTAFIERLTVSPPFG